MHPIYVDPSGMFHRICTLLSLIFESTADNLICESIYPMHMLPLTPSSQPSSLPNSHPWPLPPTCFNPSTHASHSNKVKHPRRSQHSLSMSNLLTPVHQIMTKTTWAKAGATTNSWWVVLVLQQCQSVSRKLAMLILHSSLWQLPLRHAKKHSWCARMPEPPRWLGGFLSNDYLELTLKHLEKCWVDAGGVHI